MICMFEMWYIFNSASRPCHSRMFVSGIQKNKTKYGYPITVLGHDKYKEPENEFNYD